MATIGAVQVIGANTTMFGTLLWPRTIVTAFLVCHSILFIEALIISYQRHAFETADRARRELAVALEQQRRLNVLKDDLLTSINHELRTPLTTVHGYLELLRDHEEQLDASMRAAFVQQAIGGCEELLALTSKMFDAAAVGKSGSLQQYESLALAPLVNEVLERFKLEAEVYTIHIDVPEELRVRADARYMRYILHNLLANAFKYSPHHSEVCIKAFLDSTETAYLPYVDICVQDTGRGIPQNEIASLFNRFARLKRDLAGPIRGAGLSLYICKQLVESMGGNIQVESTGIPGEGSTFSFRLPSASVAMETKNMSRVVDLRPQAETANTRAAS